MAVLCLISGAIFYIHHDIAAIPPDHRIHISYSISVQNPTNQAVESASVGVKGPVRATAFQRCTEHRSDKRFSLFEEELNHDLLKFEWEVFAPFTTKKITIRSDLDLWKEPRRIPEKGLENFLKPEPLIESDDAGIMALAHELRKETALETIQRTFEWVSEKIVYTGYAKRARGARYALTHLKGDCTEYAYLFTALCRANGIPARVVGGFVCRGDTVLDMTQYHDWAEFYHDGRWHIADPQRKRLMREQDTYIAFSVGQLEREASFIVADLKGEGLIVKFSGQK